MNLFLLFDYFCFSKCCFFPQKTFFFTLKTCVMLGAKCNLLSPFSINMCLWLFSTVHMNWKLSKKTVTEAFKASNHAKAEHNSNVCVLSAVEVCSCQAQRQTCGMCLHYVQRGQLVTRDSVTSTKQQSEDLSAWIKTFVCVHIHNLFNQSIVTNGSLWYFCFFF